MVYTVNIAENRLVFATVVRHGCLHWVMTRYSIVDTMVEIGPRKQIMK